MRRLRVLGALLLWCALAGSVEAGPRRVRIVKTDGTVVEGVLEERKDRVYKLTADGKAVSIAESDVLRVDFLGDDAREVDPPRSPWLHAKPGDWATYVQTNRDAAGAVVGSGAITWRVLAVDGSDVTIETIEEGPRGAELTTHHDHKDREFMAGAGWGRYESEKVAVARDRLVLGDRSFDCTKASIVVEREPPQHTNRDAVWIDETLPIGFVELDHVQDTKGSDKQVLAGYGNGDGVVWGKRREEISPRKRIQPWKDVKTGDWWSYATVEDHKPGFETWSAKQADGELVALDLGQNYQTHRGDDPLEWLAMSAHPGSTVRAVRSATLLDEHRTVLGRTFECTTLSAECEDDGGKAVKLMYSFAKDGTPPIVACSFEGGRVSYEAELRGYGSKDVTAWGKTQAELEAPASEKIQPWKNVKTGDWWSYAIVESGKLRFETWSVHDADGDLIGLDIWKSLRARRSDDAVAWLRENATKHPDELKVGSFEDDTRTILGRSFPCARLSVQFVEHDGSAYELTLWFSKEDGAPLVAVSGKGGGKDAYEAELRGYGNAGATTWGKTKAQLEARSDEAKPAK